MKPGMAIGQSKTIELEVTHDMVVRYEGKTIHELYSTSFLVQHMELSARKLITPHLDSDEESLGCHVEVSHLAMTLPGMRVRIDATIVDIRENRVVVEVEASNLRGKIARGTLTQAIIDRTWLTKRMKEIRVLQNIATERTPSSTCSNSR